MWNWQDVNIIPLFDYRRASNAVVVRLITVVSSTRTTSVIGALRMAVAITAKNSLRIHIVLAQPPTRQCNQLK